MPVQTYVSVPTEIEAIQWAGDNLEEVQEFVGSPTEFVSGFSPPGHDWAGISEEDRRTKPALWVAANDAWLPIDLNEWIAKDSHGFYPIKDDVFARKYRLKQ